MSTNWFQSPLAVDAALQEPLKRALGSNLPLLAAVRSLLIRRCLTEVEAAMLTRARLSVLDVSAAFSKLESEVRAASPKARTGMLTLAQPSAARTPAAEIAPTTLRLMIKATAHAVRNAGGLEGLVHAETIATNLGAGIARVLSEDLFPPLGDPDANSGLREVVARVLGDRRVPNETLDAIGPMDRMLVAQRLESRQELMMAVVPPSRAVALRRVLDAACVLLRQAPPVDADTLNRALVNR